MDEKCYLYEGRQQKVPIGPKKLLLFFVCFRKRLNGDVGVSAVLSFKEVVHCI